MTARDAIKAAFLRLLEERPLREITEIGRAHV